MIKKYHGNTPIDTSKKTQDGQVIHPNTDVQEIYVDPPKIKEEIKQTKEAMPFLAYV